MSEQPPSPYLPPVPDLIDTDESARARLAALPDDNEPVAADTERASGFRYVQRAYLIQLKTAASGIWLIDPTGLGPDVFAELDAKLAGREWVLHAASQDLPSLNMAGLTPRRLFDTEVAARLLGREHVGLGALVEDVLGITLAKTHANSDWSQRPLPEDWLSYAAGDVEFLVELAAVLKEELAAAGKLEWAQQEFEYLLSQPAPAAKEDPWRSTTDIHLVRTRRGLGLVRALWFARDEVAQALDLAPHRVVNDRAITGMAARVPDQIPAAMVASAARRDWTRRLPASYAHQFSDAVDAVSALPETELPPLRGGAGSPPPTRQWSRRNPAAAKRWAAVRPAIAELAEANTLPQENLISPRALRTLLWETSDPSPASIDQQLSDLSVRPWQRALVTPVISGILGTLPPT